MGGRPLSLGRDLQGGDQVDDVEGGKLSGRNNDVILGGSLFLETSGQEELLKLFKFCPLGLINLRVNGFHWQELKVVVTVQRFFSSSLMTRWEES